jgi:hypothetical protein
VLFSRGAQVKVYAAVKGRSNTRALRSSCASIRQPCAAASDLDPFDPGTAARRARRQPRLYSVDIAVILDALAPEVGVAS